jgi:DivIVA domain-containing protein
MARSAPDVFLPGEKHVFLFLLIAMVVVVAGVTLAVVGGGDRAVLPEAGPERLVDPLPMTRPVGRADIEELRLPVAVRGYRMGEVDDVLGRLGAELAERDARIAELEAALAGVQATRTPSPGLFRKPGEENDR